MKVTILIDNNPHPDSDLYYEHGLSLYFEADGYKWLFDTGASDKFHSNAEMLGIRIEDVDFLIISHGHSDHTGGLKHFLEINKKAKVFISSYVRGKSFYSYRRENKRNISIDADLLNNYPDRFVFVSENVQVSEHVSLISQYPTTYPQPKGNDTLSSVKNGCEIQDSFDHEITLAINDPKKEQLIVFSGCSHNGILNILSACSAYFNNTNIRACIGGTHLIDSDEKNLFESEIEVRKIAEAITDHYPNMLLITGHCTGCNAAKALKNILKNRLATFHSGASFEL